jgi:hypothetical protein
VHAACSHVQQGREYNQDALHDIIIITDFDLRSATTSLARARLTMSMSMCVWGCDACDRTLTLTLTCMRQSRCSDEYGEDSDWPEDEGVMDQPDDEIEDELEGEFLSDGEDPESAD